ncbi:MFS transporter [Picrophilus oshimae]|uniref:Predicted arabinose efflux permease, MFS family n=1 Tax=Picrophilus torridus (strain ATCC 700027 / DSM 9790 / JCM 10055 / NBRC 100828 / KAW 2/3) TaxID=1122961 RepID=A0A8G2L7J1_PICTO|nr:MFS transporter [Picrophilus oshimae]SMD30374.1 Predicted arabinose efflux permease, MFS family [Picrophilus oshimae DSM 9789]
MKNKYKVLFVTTLSTVMAAIDSTIIYLALPFIGRDLHGSISELTWLLVSYIISSTIILIPGIKITARIGRRLSYIYGFLLFSLSSLGITVSPYIILSIILRFIEGLGAGILSITDIPVILDAFDDNKSTAIGINSISWGIGTIAGPLIGGYLSSIDWRLIFLINVPIGIIAIPFAYRYIPSVRSMENPDSYSIIAAAMMIPLIVGITFINKYFIIAGIILIIPALIIYRRHPFISRKLLNLRIFLLGLSIFFEAFAFFAVIYILSLYFEADLGYNPIYASLLIIWYPVSSLIFNPVGGYISDYIKKPYLIMGIGALAESLPIIFIGRFMFYIPEMLFISGAGGSIYWPPSTTALADSYSDARTDASSLLFIIRNTSLLLSISLIPLFIFFYSGIDISLGNLFILNERLNIYNSVSYFLIFIGVVNMLSIIPLIILRKQNF